MKIWIDLANSPHVPFFSPIIAALRPECEVVVTARDCFQVCGLAELAGLDFTKVGCHFGKWKALKVAGTIVRALQLAPIVCRERPTVAVSHGSRSQRILAAALGIPSILLMDYEFAAWLPWCRPTKVLIPEVVAKRDVPMDAAIIANYPGTKEDVYVPYFTPRQGVLSDLGLAPGKVIVTVRPPADKAHYHTPESERLFSEVVGFLGRFEHVTMVMLSRSGEQSKHIEARWPELFRTGRIVIPRKVVDGLNLMWHSDLVISGGGTMNREAAALGMPVYSTFRGRTGAVDRYLESCGRLVMLHGPEDFARLRLEKRPTPAARHSREHRTLDFIVEQILGLARRLSDPSIPQRRIKHWLQWRRR
jgi:predicted glycosyltransferase